MEDGRVAIASEVTELKERKLPLAIEALQEAQSQGDASQNPDSFIASEEIARLNARIAHLEAVLALPHTGLPEGTLVTLDFGDGPEKFRIALSPGLSAEGEEAITPGSPLGQALASADEGDEITFGRFEAKVLEVRLPDRV